MLKSQGVLHKNITAAREARGLTKSELARRCKVAAGSITNWESGAAVPRKQHLRKLAAVLETTVSALYREARTA